MKVKLNDVNGDPVEIYCDDTDELEAAIDVLQEKGILPEPEGEDDETEDEPHPAAAPVAEAAPAETVGSRERQGG